MNKKLELELTARQEAEAKFLTLQDKMKELETENIQMKEKVFFIFVHFLIQY